MHTSNILFSPDRFSELLYEKLQQVNAGVGDLAPYEFRYGLDNLRPGEGGWAAVTVDGRAAVEAQVNRREFYAAIQLKPRVAGQIVLDEAIAGLTRMLFVGLATGEYPPEWVSAHFSFDLRGFYFLHRTRYLTQEAAAHLGGMPFRVFEPQQRRFDRCDAIGYKDFEAANAEIDGAFIESIVRLSAARGAPILLAIAGPTAAGKTEIVARLRDVLTAGGRTVAAIEMDNFLTDRDYREEHGIGSLGRAAIHFELFRSSLAEIMSGRKITTPRYDFICATSSHDRDGRLKPGCAPLEIAPADIVFVEGNFPFLIPEIAGQIGIKVVYLTDDAIRLKRKWKRDIDLRKKYDFNYLRNRFFREQFLMAQACYQPQLAVCDLYVDTTGAALWATPEIAGILSVDR